MAQLLGFPGAGRVPVNASICIRAINSVASCTLATNTCFCVKGSSDIVGNPAPFELRIRSSQRARRRCRSSDSASCPPRVLAANAVRPVAVRVGEPQFGARIGVVRRGG